MKIMKCGHSDRIENTWNFSIPVYLKKDPPKAEDGTVVMAFHTPDYHIERSYCLECMIQRFDKLMRPPWWRRALDWFVVGEG